MQEGGCGMRVYKARLFDDANPCVFENIEDALDHIKDNTRPDELEAGIVLSIEVCEIDEKEFAELPEWDGP